MSYRDDLQAAHARIAALEAQIARVAPEREETVYRNGQPVMRKLRSPELQDALDAWRGVPKKQKDWLCANDIKEDVDPSTAKIAKRLLRAAA